VGSDSLIPMFESMVDRAFSRAPSEPEPGEIEDKHLVRKMSVAEKIVPSISRRAVPEDVAR
jgi:hypothetical protein